MKFQVDTNTLADDVKAMESDLDALRRSEEAMRGAVESLSGMWAGEAHDAFVVQFENDEQFLQSFLTALQKQIADLREAKENYESCESAVRSSIAGISI